MADYSLEVPIDFDPEQAPRQEHRVNQNLNEKDSCVISVGCISFGLR
jgi:hypothetical protein